MALPESTLAALNLIDEGVIFIDSGKIIRFVNHAAERMTGFTSSELLGRACEHGCLRFEVTEHDKLCKGVCRTELALRENQEHRIGIHLQHKEGYRLPVSLRMIPFRETENGPVSGLIEIFTDESLLRRLQEETAELRRQALLDPLTELPNRRYGEMQLARQFEEFQRYHQPFGLIFFDIDQFKNVNDGHGHNAGDRVLRAVGKTLLHNVRAIDTVARWGGEEFTAVIVNVDRPQLSAVAEKLRQLIEDSSIVYGTERIRTTISGGITLVRPEDDAYTLVQRADGAMYESKHAGRNRMTWS